MEVINGYIIMGLLTVLIGLIFALLKAVSAVIEELKYSTVALLNSNNELKETMETQNNPYNNDYDA
jgi:hypothetical protein